MPGMNPGGLVPRRSRKLPIDGRIPGVRYTAMRGGRHYATAPLNFGGPQDQYDPGRMFYQDLSAHYRPPDPWFEHVHVRSTPPIRLNPPERQFHPHVHYNDSLMTQALTEQALQELRQDVPALPVPLEDEMHGPRTTIHGTPTLEEQEIAPVPMVQATAAPVERLNRAVVVDDPTQADDQLAAFEPAVEHEALPADTMQPDAMDHEMPVPDPGVGGLEQIVNDMMPGPADPMDQGYGPQMTNELFEQAMHDVVDQQMPEPMQPDPYAQMQEMYDEQIAMLMNPYMAPNPMMPGPGVMPGMPGPMGPMPGP